MITVLSTFFFFFFNDTATTEIYTLSLHDALPISPLDRDLHRSGVYVQRPARADRGAGGPFRRLARGTDRRRLGPEIGRAQSELQSRLHLVCRLLLEKKKKNVYKISIH